MSTRMQRRFAALGLALLLSCGVASAATTEKTFATPEDALTALVAAVKAQDRKALQAVLGTSYGSVESGDPLADRAAAQAFVAAYEQKHTLQQDGNTVHVVVGSNEFPFAFPLVKTGDRWHFDSEAGREELLARRIGQNELDAIKVLQAVVDAQREYASEDRDGDGVLAYASRLASTPGKHDGLYWKTKDGEAQSPLGELVARAAGEGYGPSKSGPTPYHGYYYRLLKGQAAIGGAPAFDYRVRGRAIGGFAMIAYPAKYGSSGIMTFIVNQDGKVYQSDLGPQTAARASAIQRFDPGKGWTAVTSP